MAQKRIKTDIAILGAGIAGLWLFHSLKRQGYNAVLLEKNAIGSGQTIASQGILHSGLKYTMAGKVNELARSISQMPDVWRACLKGEGPVDLTSAKIAAPSQQLLIPKGFMGGIVKTISEKMLGDSVSEIPADDWPADISAAGFEGAIVNMDELVLDIPSVIKALAEPYKDHILRADSAENIDAQLYIYTGAASNHDIAKASGHDKGLETQHRPLLMGMIKNAPFPLFAHLVGTSEKPVATITSHTATDGTLVWYLGGGVAERAKDAPAEDVYNATRKALQKYLPNIYTSKLEWAVLPIDRVEGKSNTDGWMPDTPTIHEVDNHLYCWPTKLTFAPMLADMVIEKINAKSINPSQENTSTEGWTKASYAQTPWDETQFTKTSLRGMK